MKINKYDIKYDRPITLWDEALPIGNGKLGCLIYGDSSVRLGLDRCDLWDTRPHPFTLEKGFNFKNLVSLVKDGSDQTWKEYCRLFDQVFTDKAYPSKITAGRLVLNFNESKVKSSSVDIYKAIATVNIENGSKIESFASATEFVGVCRILGEYSLSINIPKYISENSNDKKHLGYPKAQIITDGDFIYYVQDTHTDFKYGIVVLNKKLENESQIYYTIATSNDDENFIEKSKAQLLKAYQTGYETLKEKHIKWWKKYWNKSKLSVGDELIEKTYYRSWYLFASCSRKGFYPMPIQGVWTADNDSLPPWKGDYHHDTNTELSYQAYLKANRLEEGKVFVDYLWKLSGEYKKFAKDFFGVDGILIPSASSIYGKPMGGWAHYALSPTMTIWAAQSFDEYYIYTGDEKFLKNRAYPFFKQVGKAIYALLEQKDGKLYLPLSTSPEIFDDSREAYLEPNSNFDLALLIYLFKTLDKYENILGLPNVSRDVLSKLDDIALDDDKFIKLDKTKRLNESHRHFSHLMCLYPLHLINYDSERNKKIYHGSLFEIERLGMGMWVGFSYAMCAQIYAMALMGNSAYEKLYQFCKGFVADNGFHLNGDFKNYGYSTFHYRPFTLESSFGFCDALHEMLIQDHQGYIHLFPAIPEEWKGNKIKFNKFRTCGGLIISAEYNKEKISVVFNSDKERSIKILNNFNIDQIIVSNNDKQYTLKAQDGYFNVNLSKGKTIIK